MFLIFGILFALVSIYLGVRSKTSAMGQIYKLSSYALLFFSVFFLLLFVYYEKIGGEIASFYNNGFGIEYSDLDKNTTEKFFTKNSKEVGEYFALLKAERSIFEILATLAPYAALIVVIYIFARIAELMLYRREKIR
jgi:hypothetical protein